MLFLEQTNMVDRKSFHFDNPKELFDFIRQEFNSLKFITLSESIEKTFYPKDYIYQIFIQHKTKASNKKSTIFGRILSENQEQLTEIFNYDDTNSN